MALKNSKTGSLPVSEIYSFMKEHFPYFKVGRPSTALVTNVVSRLIVDGFVLTQLRLTDKTSSLFIQFILKHELVWWRTIVRVVWSSILLI